MRAHSLTILHVEDNPDHARLIVRCLQDSRPDDVIHLVEDGEAALDYLLRRGDYQDPATSPIPHVVLLDLRIPTLDGWEVLRTIKTSETLSAIPVVILTSSESDADIDQAYEYHANSYLVKPIDFERFDEMMSHFSSFWLRWNRCHWPSEAAASDPR